jgi:CheY-like chemotaxis protein
VSDDRPRILVVEDNALIAMDVEFLVEECGCAVVGPAGTVGEALEAIRHAPPDGAVLDINLGDERVWPVADCLAARAVPFVFASGYGRSEVLERFSGRRLLTKPLTLEILREALDQIGVIRT